MDRNENRVPNHFAQRPNHVTIKPQSFDGSEDFDEYLTQFEMLCDLHGWDYRTIEISVPCQQSNGWCPGSPKLTQWRPTAGFQFLG